MIRILPSRETLPHGIAEIPRLKEEWYKELLMYFSPFSLSEDGLLLEGSDFVAMEDRFAAPITFVTPIAVDDVSESLPEKFPSDGAA